MKGNPFQFDNYINVPHLNVVVTDNLVILVHRGLEQLVAEIPLDSNPQITRVFKELVQTFADLNIE